MICISYHEARKLALSHQGLLSAKPKFGRGKKAVLKAIEHLGYVQIDAISVIQRAHHHTLWSRIPDYQPKHLNTLLNKDRQIFEYWSHAAAFLPIKDYQFYQPMMLKLQEKGKHWYEVDPPLKAQVLQKIKDNGPLYARDFETPKSNSKEMWGWKPAKQALHELFMEGTVAVVSRDGFQRLYDLAERVIPTFQSQDRFQSQPQIQFHTQTHTQSSISHSIWHRCQQAMQAHGIVSIPEIRYQRDISTEQVENILEEQESFGSVIRVKVEGSDWKFWGLPGVVNQIPAKVYKQIHFLSPFDNAVIQRKRIKELFNFDYQTEIYYPVNKRKYGYFSLPILYGTQFIGRMDPKAHRASGILEVRNLVLEPGIKADERLIHYLNLKLKQFAEFNQCTSYEITTTTPQVLKSAFS